MYSLSPPLQPTPHSPNCSPTSQIVGNFGLDVMEALSGTCTLWVMGRRGIHHVVCDAVVAFVVVLLHAVILMCEVRGRRGRGSRFWAEAGAGGRRRGGERLTGRLAEVAGSVGECFLLLFHRSCLQSPSHASPSPSLACRHWYWPWPSTRSVTACWACSSRGGPLTLGGEQEPPPAPIPALPPPPLPPIPGPAGPPHCEIGLSLGGTERRRRSGEGGGGLAQG
jgi:hypothetical protein